jgi:hypothetical protein
MQINPDKYFEGITPELWNYRVGSYQVLHKYLKDRKGNNLADPIHYNRMVTALVLTIDIQARIDQIIGNVIQWKSPGCPGLFDSCLILFHQQHFRYMGSVWCCQSIEIDSR